MNCSQIDGKIKTDVTVVYGRLIFEWGKMMNAKMEIFGSDPKSLYMLNQELAARVYTVPSLML